MFLRRINILANEIEIIDQFGAKTRRKFTLKDEFKAHRSDELLKLSNQIKKRIEILSPKCLDRSPRIGVLCSNNYTYLASIIASFLCNATAIPLNRSHPKNLLDYYVSDSKCDILIKNDSESYSKKNISEIVLDDKRFYLDNIRLDNERSSLKDVIQFQNNQSDALILYTSGTSSRPKGVVMTYSNLHASIENLTHCWRLNSNDAVLNALPLNHVHGLVYCLLAPLLLDAKCVLLPKFNPKLVWEKILNRDVNIVSGVPTMYYKLLEEAESFSDKRLLKEKLQGFKLFASASAPLSRKLSDQWFDLTGFRLMDRYGLSESSGLVFGNSVDENVCGSVGRPGFNFTVRLISQAGKILIESSHENDKFFESDKKTELAGELEIKGPGVFRTYLNNPELTRDSFTTDGWFRTGDTAQYLADSHTFKIIGRTSVDVIKSGGFRVSALEIESCILEHELVEDVAVFGLDDEQWGQLVMALLVVKHGFNNHEFINWCTKMMSKPSVPKIIECVSCIERNQMGKVDKKSLVKKYSTRQTNNSN